MAHLSALPFVGVLLCRTVVCLYQRDFHLGFALNTSPPFRLLRSFCSVASTTLLLSLVTPSGDGTSILRTISGL